MWGKFKINSSSSSCLLIQLQTVIRTYLACFADLALISKILTKLIAFEKYSFIWNKTRLVALFTAGAVVTTHMTVVAATSIIILTTDLLCRCNGNLSQVQEIFAFCDCSSPGSVLWRVSAASSQAKWEQRIWEALTADQDLTRGLLSSNFYLAPWDGRGVGNKSSFGLQHMELAQWWGRSQPFQVEIRQDENKRKQTPSIYQV